MSTPLSLTTSRIPTTDSSVLPTLQENYRSPTIEEILNWQPDSTSSSKTSSPIDFPVNNENDENFKTPPQDEQKVRHLRTLLQDWFLAPNDDELTKTSDDLEAEMESIYRCFEIFMQISERSLNKMPQEDRNILGFMINNFAANLSKNTDYAEYASLYQKVVDRLQNLTIGFTPPMTELKRPLGNSTTGSFFSPMKV